MPNTVPRQENAALALLQSREWVGHQDFARALAGGYAHPSFARQYVYRLRRRGYHIETWRSVGYRLAP